MILSLLALSSPGTSMPAPLIPTNLRTSRSFIALIRASAVSGPVLVTGATGNVGRQVVRLLLDADQPVRAAAQSRSTVADAFGDAVEAVALDFTDPGTWDAAYTGVRRIFLLRPPRLGWPRTQMVPSLEHARALGVEQMALLPLQGGERNPVVPHAALEGWLRQSGPSWTSCARRSSCKTSRRCTSRTSGTAARSGSLPGAARRRSWIPRRRRRRSGSLALPGRAPWPGVDTDREMPSSHECRSAGEETALWMLHFADEAEFSARDGLVAAARVLGQWVPGCGIGV